LVADVKQAFPSANLEAILTSPAAMRHLPESLRNTLRAIYKFYSPSGIGIPLGLPTSPALFRIAMAEVDAFLLSLNLPAFRYVDDILVLVPRTMEEG